MPAINKRDITSSQNMTTSPSDLTHSSYSPRLASKHSIPSTPTDNRLTSSASTSRSAGQVSRPSRRPVTFRLTPPAQPSLLPLSTVRIVHSLDAFLSTFLDSSTFHLICVQAIQLAATLPCSAPPTSFTSFDATPMHHWYQALLVEFFETFLRMLRDGGLFPLLHVVDQMMASGGARMVQIEDAETFNVEAVAHANAILASFNCDFERRLKGSVEGLSVDTSQRNATVAALALQEATSLAQWPPPKGWRVGRPLCAEYKRRLRMFEVGVLRLVAEREEWRWILGSPVASGRLAKSMDVYKEFYIACLREEIMQFRNMLDMDLKNGLVVANAMEGDDDDVFS